MSHVTLIMWSLRTRGALECSAKEHETRFKLSMALKNGRFVNYACLVEPRTSFSLVRHSIPQQYGISCKSSRIRVLICSNEMRQSWWVRQSYFLMALKPDSRQYWGLTSSAFSCYQEKLQSGDTTKEQIPCAVVRGGRSCTWRVWRRKWFIFIVI